MDLATLRARLDRGLSARPRVTHDRSDLVSAAVLVPITDRGEPHLVFSKKTAAVPHHQGQFAFPGGIVHERDASRVETALREAWEEIRLPAAAVEVLGLLDDTLTRATAFVITGANEAEIAASRALVRQQISFYASTRTYRGVLEAHGWGDVSERLNEKAAKGDWAGMAREITDEMLEVYAVTGTYDEIPGKLRAKYDGVLDRVGHYMPYQPGKDEHFYRSVIEALRG